MDRLQSKVERLRIRWGQRSADNTGKIVETGRADVQQVSVIVYQFAWLIDLCVQFKYICKQQYKYTIY